jgi:hypothetical protein
MRRAENSLEGKFWPSVAVDKYIFKGAEKLFCVSK